MERLVLSSLLIDPPAQLFFLVFLVLFSGLSDISVLLALLFLCSFSGGCVPALLIGALLQQERMVAMLCVHMA